MPDEAFTAKDESVHLHLTEQGVIDNIKIFGPGTDYANATIDITWTPVGKVRHYKPGSTNPLDPSDFAGAFRNATARANFTVLLEGVTFTINNATSSGIFAEMGNERNGLFLEE